ncbi:Small ribosomal subunit protein [Trichinella spiralis]|uniref:Small ribosomal subunit protein n=2 Tax=Trichinella spiralis TaxID=6334 RepID=A0ABR3K271_TRISP
MSQDTTGSEVSSGSLFQHWVFSNKDELHEQMVKLNMAKKDERKWRTQNVLQIRYHCKETRKFPYCDAYFSARCEADGTVESYGGVVHNHSFRKPTTRLPSPTREKVLQCLKKGINDMKTIHNILIKKGCDVSEGQLRHLVYYHRRKELKKPS